MGVLLSDRKSLPAQAAVIVSKSHAKAKDPRHDEVIVGPLPTGEYGVARVTTALPSNGEEEHS